MGSTINNHGAKSYVGNHIFEIFEKNISKAYAQQELKKFKNLSSAEAIFWASIHLDLQNFSELCDQLEINQEFENEDIKDLLRTIAQKT